MRIRIQSRYAPRRAPLPPSHGGHTLDPMPTSSSVCRVKWYQHAHSRVPQAHTSPSRGFHTSWPPTRSTTPPNCSSIRLGLFQLHRSDPPKEHMGTRLGHLFLEPPFASAAQIGNRPDPILPLESTGAIILSPHGWACSSAVISPRRSMGRQCRLHRRKRTRCIRPGILLRRPGNRYRLPKTRV